MKKELYILGINTGFNASAVLLKNNRVCFGIQEERLSKIKNHPGFPPLAIQACLDQEGLTLADIDSVAVAGISSRLPKDRESEMGKFHTRYQLIKKQWFGEKQNVMLQSWQRLQKKLGNRNEGAKVQGFLDDYLREHGILEKTSVFDHHLCHAAAAYYGLAKDKTEKYLIFTLDGGGNQKTSTVAIGHQHQLKVIAQSNSFSPACLYAHITYILGFSPHEHEYKLMGLAPYARREYAEQVRDLLYRFIGFDEKNPLVFNNTARYSKVDNSGGKPKHQLIEDIFKSVLNVRFDNLAAGLQLLAEEVAVQWIKAGIRQTGITRILLSGGYFMNVKANSLIAALPEVTSVNCFPSCGDESNAFGAAFLGYQQRRTDKSLDIEFADYCVGTSASHDMAQAQKKFQGQVQFQEVENINEVVADLLAQKKIVARCSGRMEFGARALGNRSILASPDDIRVIHKINDAIKKRDFWMPFAPAVLEDKAEELVSIPSSLREGSSPYMMFTFLTKPKARDSICAGIHQRDQTARAQMVSRRIYPEFYDLIHRFHLKTGIPAVLNTSFNLHGYPIVLGACDAIDVYLKSDLDVLVVDNFLITRKNQS